jgi:hypothetical protein
MNTVTPNAVPVLGELDRAYDWFGTGFLGFETTTIHGLARVVGGVHLELLAVWAMDPGQGDVGRFLDACQRAYESITVLEIANERFESYLQRRGFSRQEFAGTGITLRWAR